MPVIASFQGYVIRMYFDDHWPPHVHAYVGDYHAAFGLEGADRLAGHLPRRAWLALLPWALARRPELWEAWRCVQRHEYPRTVGPPDGGEVPCTTHWYHG